MDFPIGAAVLYVKIYICICNEKIRFFIRKFIIIKFLGIYVRKGRASSLLEWLSLIRRFAMSEIFEVQKDLSSDAIFCV